MEAAPSNPHGHFESMPFYELNRQVQELALGFPDDLPGSPEVLSRFVSKSGRMARRDIEIPDELLDRVDF